MATLTSIKPALAPFPAEAIRSALRAGLVEAIQAEASMKGIKLPSTPAGIAQAAIDVDSLVAVDVVCIVEPIVGFELPQNVVRTGGYPSADAAVEHLLPRIESEWNKRKGGKA